MGLGQEFQKVFGYANFIFPWSFGLYPVRQFPFYPFPPSPCTLCGMPQASEILERVFREEYGRIIATLIRLSGSFDLAEESLQEAFAAALTAWAHDGVPHNPAAWLTTVAHRKLLDVVRREKIRSEKQTELEYETARLLPETG